MFSAGSSSHGYTLIVSTSHPSASCRLSISIFCSRVHPNAKPPATTSMPKAQVSGERSEVLGGGDTQPAFPVPRPLGTLDRAQVAESCPSWNFAVFESTVWPDFSKFASARNLDTRFASRFFFFLTPPPRIEIPRQIKGLPYLSHL